VRPEEYFDDLYSASDRYWWRDKDRFSLDPGAYPYSLLTQMTLRLLQCEAPGRALDLGAGEGTDAIRLALLGYQVDAVEISTVGAEKIERFASEAAVKVNVLVADITEFAPDGFYDVVISNGVLHYVENKEAAIRRMHAATSVGGINVVSLWSTYTQVPDCHDRVPVFCDDEHGLTNKLYSEWQREFIYFDRDKTETSHSDSPPHRHSHIKLIARRTSSLM